MHLTPNLFKAKGEVEVTGGFNLGGGIPEPPLADVNKTQLSTSQNLAFNKEFCLYSFSTQLVGEIYR